MSHLNMYDDENIYFTRTIAMMKMVLGSMAKCSRLSLNIELFHYNQLFSFFDFLVCCVILEWWRFNDVLHDCSLLIRLFMWWNLWKWKRKWKKKQILLFTNEWFRRILFMDRLLLAVPLHYYFRIRNKLFREIIVKDQWVDLGAWTQQFIKNISVQQQLLRLQTGNGPEKLGQSNLSKLSSKSLMPFIHTYIYIMYIRFFWKDSLIQIIIIDGILIQRKMNGSPFKSQQIPFDAFTWMIFNQKKINKY